jgi:hypothetical protein
MQGTHKNGPDNAQESVMITFRQLFCRWFNLVPKEDWDIAQCCIINQQVLGKRKQDTIDNLQLSWDACLHQLSRAAESNADLQCKLKQVTFLEGRVQELEMKLNQTTLVPRKVVNESEPIITGRSGWRAIAQMRTQNTIPSPEDDSVAALQHKATREASGVPSR